MKKAIRPPENWQDFETLCKKLFGEIWGCPHTTKKNGRLGQPQAGVDVYGIPKGDNEYWGIQCKGKDNYLDSKLTEKEIDEEIKKAKTFEPKLKTFVFATTAPKDVSIEKYVRLKDKESRDNGNFVIVLYCWQDIADLIEENRDTFNWYVNEVKYREQFDIEVSITTGHDNYIVKPKFLKTITEYKLRPIPTSFPKVKSYGVITPAWIEVEPLSIFGSNKINHGWCTITTSITNTGSKVIEDWKFGLEFSETAKEIDDDFTKDIFMYEKLSKYRTTWAYEKEKQILYQPLNNSPLIQKDTKTFKSYCIPHFDSKEIIIKWSLLARDFNRQGEVKITVKPEYEFEYKSVFVDKTEEVKTIEEIGKYITKKRQ